MGQWKYLFAVSHTIFSSWIFFFTFLNACVDHFVGRACILSLKMSFFLKTGLPSQFLWHFSMVTVSKLSEHTSPQIIHHSMEGCLIRSSPCLSDFLIALSLVLTRSLPFSLISILAMACDWLVAVEGSKLLRPALYLAVNAPCLPFPLSPVLSDFLSVPI